MKPTISIIIAFILSLVSLSGKDRRLDKVCGNVNPEGTEWDFSDSEETSVGVIYRMYGDSLLAEVHNGRRLEYRFRNDSVFYAGEQTRSMLTAPDKAIPTGAFCQPRLAGITASTDTGIIYKRLFLSKEGDYETGLPVRGVITAGDLRIPATSITETRNYRTYQSSDTTPGKGSLHNVEVRTRWFVEGEIFPVAYQYSETVTASGKTLSEKGETYVCDFGEIRLPSPEGIRLQEALDKLNVRYTDGVLHIEGESGTGTEISLSVMTLYGDIVTSSDTFLSEGSNHIEIRLPRLPYGRYMIGVSSGGTVLRKIYFTVT